MRQLMQRREFLRWLGAAGVTLMPMPLAAQVQKPQYERLLVLVELRGGNDGLNTVIPFANPRYASLRPQLALPTADLLRLDSIHALHPGLRPLLPLWEAGHLAVLESVGYPEANLSHFRSMEIWDTASGSNEYLEDGWLARAFKAVPAPAHFAADAVVVGRDLGPFANGARAVALTNADQFAQQARLANADLRAGSGALGHLLKVERDVAQAAARLDTQQAFRSVFPAGVFGNALRTAAQVVAGRSGVAAVKVTLDGFDTHRGQAGTHARLLQTLGEGLTAFRDALIEIGRWDSTLVLTYSEFGRRPAENASGGTDHGTASVQFAMGGRVRGGFHGLPPALDRLDRNGNLPYAIDFRDVYATVLRDWWGVRPDRIMRATGPVPGFLKSTG